MTRSKWILIIIICLPVFFVLLACQMDYVIARNDATPSATRGAARTPTGVGTRSAPLIPTAALVLPTIVPIAPPTVGPLPTLVSQPQTVTATSTGNLRIRSQPTTSSSQIGTLKEGESAQVVARTAASDWLQIILPTNASQRGWISAEFATLSGALDVVPVISGGTNPPPPAVIPTQAPQPPRPGTYPYP